MNGDTKTSLTLGDSPRGTAADGVASILSAAERAAEEVRRNADALARERIAEAKRAADNQVKAAEEEAAEILAHAYQEAERLRRAAGDQTEEEKTTATSQALAILADANQAADEALERATEAAANSQREAERYCQDLLGDARNTADEVRNNGIELASNLRQLGDSLRANAELLLRDVQQVHGQMMSKIESVESGARRPKDTGSTSRRSSRDADEEIEVPDFIPPR